MPFGHRSQSSDDTAGTQQIRKAASPRSIERGPVEAIFLFIPSPVTVGSSHLQRHIQQSDRLRESCQARWRACARQQQPFRVAAAILHVNTLIEPDTCRVTEGILLVASRQSVGPPATVLSRARLGIQPLFNAGCLLSFSHHCSASDAVGSSTSVAWGNRAETGCQPFPVRTKMGGKPWILLAHPSGVEPETF